MENIKYGWHVFCLKALLVLNLLDAVFTYTWVTLGYAKEANPLMDYVISISPPGFILYKVLVVSLCVILLWRLQERWLCRALTIPLLVLYVWVMGMHISFLTLVGLSFI